MNIVFDDVVSAIGPSWKLEISENGMVVAIFVPGDLDLSNSISELDISGGTVDRVEQWVLLDEYFRNDQINFLGYSVAHEESDPSWSVPGVGSDSIKASVQSILASGIPAIVEWCRREGERLETYENSFVDDSDQA